MYCVRCTFAYIVTSTAAANCWGWQADLSHWLPAMVSEGFWNSFFTRIFNITIYLGKQFASGEKKTQPKCKYRFPQEIKSSPKLIGSSNSHNDHHKMYLRGLTLPSWSLSEVRDSIYLSEFEFTLHITVTSGQQLLSLWWIIFCKLVFT